VTAVGAFVPKATNRRHHEQSYASDPQAEALRQRIIKFMIEASNNSERSLQKAIGPSEIGHPCPRNVAYKVAGVTPNPSHLDPLPSILGVGFHAWMENNLPPGWLPESKVQVTPTLSGHSDAYEQMSRTVVDWKMLGRTTHQKWLAGEVKTVYRVQAHAYGLGFMNAGIPVERVAVAAFCKSKPLSDMYLWSEPWNPELAMKSLNRLAQIRTYVGASGASDANRAPILRIGSYACDDCFFCEFKGSPLQGLCDKGQ
jgi:hypothetical protein